MRVNERGKYNGDALHFKYVVEKKRPCSACTKAQLDKHFRFTNRKTWLYGVGKHGHGARLTRYREMQQAYVMFVAGTGFRPGDVVVFPAQCFYDSADAIASARAPCRPLDNACMS